MPFVNIRAIPDRGDQYYGAYRTLAAAQAAATADDVTALTEKVLDANIPNDAQPGQDWWVVDGPEVPRLDASAWFQWGASGKGLQLTWSAGQLGADGNGVTIETGGSSIAWDSAARTLTIPAPGAASSMNTGALLKAALEALSGAAGFTVVYLPGTSSTTDFSAFTGTQWRPWPDVNPSDTTLRPTFIGGRNAEPSRKIVTGIAPDTMTPRATAAHQLITGLIKFRAYVLSHATAVPQDAVTKVLEFVHQAVRACHLLYRNAHSGADLTAAQFIAWATFMRFGPLDTSVITALGQYNAEGLFDIFERADDPTIVTPISPQAWVDPDVTRWGPNANGVPNVTPRRLNVADILDVLPADGESVSSYLNITTFAWLREGV